MPKLTAAEMEKIRLKDAENTRRVNNTADSIASVKMSTIQTKAKAFKDNIQELVDKKSELLNAPSSKVETVALAKGALKEQRKTGLFENFLIPHLKECQRAHNIFLSTDSMRRVWERDGWRFVYGIISEEDIDKAAEMLPDIGLSVAERDAQVKKIDEDIAALEIKMREELEKM